MANRTYEVMYIVDPETAADKIVELNETIGKLIEKEGGTIVRMDDIGMRTMAYPIKKRKDGYYVLYFRDTHVDERWKRGYFYRQT